MNASSSPKQVLRNSLNGAGGWWLQLCSDPGSPPEQGLSICIMGAGGLRLQFVQRQVVHPSKG